jgi:hypothetical protein
LRSIRAGAGGPQKPVFGCWAAERKKKKKAQQGTHHIFTTDTMQAAGTKRAHDETEEETPQVAPVSQDTQTQPEASAAQAAEGEATNHEQKEEEEESTAPLAKRSRTTGNDGMSPPLDNDDFDDGKS